MRTARWYYDFISPYAYLQSEMLAPLAAKLSLTFTPVLFAGLLKHWGTIGPAETPAKRQWTYRQCLWLAEQQGIPMRLPPAHPFNPIPALRLMIAASGGDAAAERAAMHKIFRFIWRDGRDPVADFSALAAQFDLDDVDARIAAPAVKDQLRLNTEAAAEDGVFGVPSLVVDGQVFWGADSAAMALDYLERPDLFDQPEMKRIDALPAAVQRAR